VPLYFVVLLIIQLQLISILVTTYFLSAELKSCNITWAEAKRTAITDPDGELLLMPFVPLGDNRIRSGHY
jgi:hypothetical protein